MKANILRCFDINEETHRQRFRSVTKGTDESYRELTNNRIQDLGKKWLRQYDTLEKVVEAVVQEQLLNALPQYIRVWYRERMPTTSLEAGQNVAKLAKKYLAVLASTAPSERVFSTAKYILRKKRWCLRLGKCIFQRHNAKLI